VQLKFYTFKMFIMKKKLWLFIFTSLIILQLLSCKKDHTTDTPTQQVNVKKGALLFWTNNPSMLNSCGVLTIRLSNGQQTNITGYYFVAPTNCVNLFGGYLYLNEGSYTYQVSSSLFLVYRHCFKYF